MDASDNDLYKLVLPIECNTFIELYYRQPEKHCKTENQHIDEFLAQDEFLPITEKNYSPIRKIDCVILHPTCRAVHKDKCPDLQTNSSGLFIEQIYGALKPEAAVVIKGQIQLEFSMQGLINLFNIFSDSLKKPDYATSFNSYLRLLRDQGFRNIRSFIVVSGWNDPHSLVSTDYTTSKYFFTNYIESHRKEYSYFKYLFMKLLVTLNLICYMEKNFLIVAQK